MNRLLLALATATLACERPPEPVDEPPEDVPAPEEALAIPPHLDARVDEYVAQWGSGWPAFRFHGEIGVSSRGHLVLERAYGDRDLAEQAHHEGDAPFRIGTLSAHVTIATALALVQQGVLSLDDRVDRWVPDRGIPHALTIEHLLTHTSGLPSFTDDLVFPRVKHLPRTHEELVSTFAGHPLEFEPGTDFAPSNSNSVLLALAIQRATGRTYEDVAREHVLDPLDMDRTAWGSAAGETIGLVFDEAEHLERPARVDPRAFGASGGWISTTADLHRLYAALAFDRFGGERMHLRWFGANPHEQPYAFVETTIEGRTGYMWLGLIDGFNSAVIVVPDDALVVTVLGNSEVVPAGDVASDVTRLVYGSEVPERVEPRPAPIAAEELERTIGEWVITRGSEDALLDEVDPDTFDMLRQVVTMADASGLTLGIPNHGRKRMHPRSPGRFFFMDGPQSTARLERGTTPERDVLVLARDGSELRYVRAPARIVKAG
jgi:CubicO group peptidase (beta-lactamase class C family)